MKHQAKSIRPFIGAKDYSVSRHFYSDLGFEVQEVGEGLSVCKAPGMSFYLQNAYVKEWIENTMIFVEVDDVHRYWDELVSLGLSEKYEGVRLVPIRFESWGKECFLIDPSGILWHFGEFNPG